MSNVKSFIIHHGLHDIALKCYRFIKAVGTYLWLLSLNIFLRPFLRRPKYKKKFKIAICGIFKNEAPFLKEWIEFHEMIGVEHFYLYNNNSDDTFLEVLQPYIDRGIVTLTDWPFDQAQMKAYKHFYETYRHETQWVSFLDLDEFFCPKGEVFLIDWLKRNDKYPVLLCYWRMFGTSNVLQHDYSKLCIEQYFVSWKYYDKCGKCLVNTDYDIARFDSSTHHETTVIFKILGIPFRVGPANALGRFVKDQFHFSDERKCDKMDIQINHYWTKGWDVYSKKRQLTDVYFKENPKKDLEYFFYHENKNVACDYTIFRYLIRLKIKMHSIC